MALDSSPAIPRPRSVDLGVLAQIAVNTEIRLRKIEEQSNTLASQFSASKDTSTIQAQTQQILNLTTQVNTLAAAVKALANAAPMQASLILMEMEGEHGEDGLTIPGERGPQGEPGAVVLIEGDEEEADFYPPP
jgi:hypothetical protein